MNLSKFYLALIIIVFNGCRNDVYSPDVCFQENVLPIFVSKCSMQGCHSASEKEQGYDLSNYEGIIKGIKPGRPHLSEIFRAINGKNPSMPVGGKLSAREVTYIKLWIQMGAHNTSNCIACDSTVVGYTKDIRPMIDNWCLGCHNSNNAGGGYDFSVYSGVVKSITDNRLLGCVQQLQGYSAMPAGNKLSDCNIALIKKWVNEGYPNN